MLKSQALRVGWRLLSADPRRKQELLVVPEHRHCRASVFRSLSASS